MTCCRAVIDRLMTLSAFVIEDYRMRIVMGRQCWMMWRSAMRAAGKSCRRAAGL